MTTKITAAVVMIAAAVVMFLAANLPDSVIIAPKTKIAVPCPDCPLQAVWMLDEFGQRVLILKQELPKPMLLASPAAKPRPQQPKPGKSPAAYAMQIQRRPQPCVPICD
jgi:hypothetical protein